MKNMKTFPCLFRLLTGFYCPGCGGTRALAAFLHGQWLQSFIFHPIVLYMFCSVLLSLVMRLKKGKRERDGHDFRLEEALVYAGLCLVAVNWLLKNVLLFWGFDLLA